MSVGFFGGKFLPPHRGHLAAIIDASTQVDELYVVLSASEKRDRALCERDHAPQMPAQQRMSWLGESLSGLERITLLEVDDDQGIEDYDWQRGAQAITRAIGKPIDVVFSSEPSYEEHFRTGYPDARHVVLDPERTRVPVSATDIRRDPYAHWEMLPASVRPFFTKRVAIVGTESVGKSTLVKQLAAYYDTGFVPEVGRAYCERYKNQLTRAMFDQIAMEHNLAQERVARHSNKVLFVDSDAVITQYYLDMYLPGERSEVIDAIARTQRYDLVLYLAPDVPWVADGLRFAGDPEVRAANDRRLREMYDTRGIAYQVIGGTYQERFAKARAAIDALFTPRTEPS